MLLMVNKSLLSSRRIDFSIQYYSHLLFGLPQLVVYAFNVGNITKILYNVLRASSTQATQCVNSSKVFEKLFIDAITISVCVCVCASKTNSPNSHFFKIDIMPFA